MTERDVITSVLFILSTYFTIKYVVSSIVLYLDENEYSSVQGDK